ncbi:MFS transporter [Fluviispira sanaruensis]|uniref:MFS transporter n=1 Tax=Fluviispira sanaruensis TaxID=2493639 RepID=A0A4P2VI57_FLUSA|nr:MFS transporter [Fluviispira sanaruensis]BBH52411.1 MFS transporter [Fluviispira sanaruensis]
MLEEYFKLFKINNYAKLWLAQFISVIGETAYHVAYFWLVYKMSPSSFVTGLVILCFSAPYLLFGMIGGVYADRLNKKNLMIFCDIIRALLIVTVPLAFYYEFLNLTQLAIVAFISSSVRCFFQPSLKSSVNDILPIQSLQIGVSIFHAAFQSSRVLGFAIGGILIAQISAPQIYLITFMTHTIAAILAITLKGDWRKQKNPVKENILKELGKILSIIKGNLNLFWSFAIFPVGLIFIVGLDKIALPILSDQIWKINANGLGYMLSAFAIGNVVSSLIISKRKINNLLFTIFVGWSLWGFFYAGIGLTTSLVIALFLAFFAGISESIIDVPHMLLIQNEVPKEHIGKVYSFWSTIAFAGDSLSGIWISFLLGFISPKQSYIFCGVIVFLLGSVAAIFLTRVKLKAMLRTDEVK